MNLEMLGNTIKWIFCGSKESLFELLDIFSTLEINPGRYFELKGI